MKQVYWLKKLRPKTIEIISDADAKRFQKKGYLRIMRNLGKSTRGRKSKETERQEGTR